MAYRVNLFDNAVWYCIVISKPDRPQEAIDAARHIGPELVSGFFLFFINFPSG